MWLMWWKITATSLERTATLRKHKFEINLCQKIKHYSFCARFEINNRNQLVEQLISPISSSFQLENEKTASHVILKRYLRARE